MATEHLQVLKALDDAKTRCYHVRVLIVAGMGIFFATYNLFSFSLVTPLLGRIYYSRDGAEGVVPVHVSTFIDGVRFWGLISGHLFLGWLGDRRGRKWIYEKTLILLIIGSVGSGFSFGKTPTAIMYTLCFFRFLLGFGIGGVFPLCSTIMSEYSNKYTRGTFIAAVFAFHGLGIFAAWMVMTAVTAAFKFKAGYPYDADDPLGFNVPEADYIWRIILMLGSIPASFTYYLLKEMPETPRYTALVTKNARQAAADMRKAFHIDLDAEHENSYHSREEIGNGYALFTKQFFHRHGLHLLGTSSGWFFSEAALYCLITILRNTFSVARGLPEARNISAVESATKISRAEIMIELVSISAGTLFSLGFIDKMGRLAIQLMGFVFMTICMLGLAIPYHHWNLPDQRVGSAMMFSITVFFAYFGPRTTTFVMAAEIYPARLRCTCHGMSAAAGKTGGLVARFWFLFVIDAVGTRSTLFILCFTNLLGLFCTILIPESKGKSLEEMSGEGE